MMFLAVVAAGGWLLLRQTVQDRLTEHLQNKLQEKLQPAGLQVSVGQAQLIEGSGIRVHDLVLQPQPLPSSTPASLSSLEIYELFVRVDATVEQLLLESPEPTGIELKRARIRLVRGVDGKWDWLPVLQRLLNLQPSGNTEIPMQLTDGEIEILDQRPGHEGITRFSGVQMAFRPVDYDGRRLWQLHGAFQTTSVAKFELNAYLDPATQQWQSQLTVRDARLSPDWLHWLPAELLPISDMPNVLAGMLDLKVQANGKFPLAALPDFSLTAQLEQFAIQDSQLPFRIRGGAARLTANSAGINVTNVRGQVDETGTIEGSYSQLGLTQVASWKLDGNVKQMRINQRPTLLRWMPEYFQEFCADYSPAGVCDIDFHLKHDGQRLTKRLTGHLSDMSFAWVKLPYQVNHCHGLVTWVNDHCDFDVRSEINQQPVRMHGHMDNIGKGATYQVNLLVPGAIPIDQKLLEATEAMPKLSRVIHDFQPTGWVGGTGVIERLNASGPTERKFDIQLKRCRARHTKFDYPIDNIVGLVQVRGDDYTFSNLRGQNSSGVVDCNGTWDPLAGLKLRFVAHSVPLNDQLKYALKPEHREIWNGFRPRGKLDYLKVDLTTPIGASEPDVAVEAVMKPVEEDPEANYVSIYPVWFPYQLNHLTGRLNVGKGVITLRDLRGQHQKTWMTCEGRGQYDNDSWSVRLSDLHVGTLRVDDDLLQAVPDSVAPALTQLRYQGLANVGGEITVAGTRRPETLGIARRRESGQTLPQTDDLRLTEHRSPVHRTSLAWDLRFDMSQAQLQLGLPVDNVYGSFRLTGLYDGTNLHCDGQLDIDSLTIYDTQITNVQGPFRIENGQVLAGRFVDRKTSLGQQDVSPLQQDSTADSITGVLHGGVVRIGALVNSSAQQDFYVEATLNDSCLGTACREWAPDLQGVEGRSFARVRMLGDASGTHSHRGEGSIQLRDAKIYELPLFISLLKILNVRQPSRTAFDSSNIDFTIEGEVIDFGRMEFLGDAISLIGNGKMNLDRDIQLNFYSVMGRNRINIPLISDLYRASSQKTLWIEVNGTLEEPQMHRHVLSGFNESLRQLFQPPDGTIRDSSIRPASLVTPVGENFFQQPDSRPFQFSTGRQ